MEGINGAKLIVLLAVLLIFFFVGFSAAATKSSFTILNVTGGWKQNCSETGMVSYIQLQKNDTWCKEGWRGNGTFVVTYQGKAKKRGKEYTFTLSEMGYSKEIKYNPCGTQWVQIWQNATENYLDPECERADLLFCNVLQRTIPVQAYELQAYCTNSTGIFFSLDYTDKHIDLYRNGTMIVQQTVLERQAISLFRGLPGHW